MIRVYIFLRLFFKRFCFFRGFFLVNLMCFPKFCFVTRNSFRLIDLWQFNGGKLLLPFFTSISHYCNTMTHSTEIIMWLYYRLFYYFRFLSLTTAFKRKHIFKYERLLLKYIKVIIFCIWKYSYVCIWIYLICILTEQSLKIWLRHLCCLYFGMISLKIDLFIAIQKVRENWTAKTEISK